MRTNCFLQRSLLVMNFLVRMVTVTALSAIVDQLRSVSHREQTATMQAAAAAAAARGGREEGRRRKTLGLKVVVMIQVGFQKRALGLRKWALGRSRSK